MSVSSDLRLIVGNTVSRRATLVTSDAECRRLFGSLWKTKRVIGTVTCIQICLETVLNLEVTPFLGKTREHGPTTPRGFIIPGGDGQKPESSYERVVSSFPTRGHCSTSKTNKITLTIPAATKNSIQEHVYEIREWHGYMALRYSILMEPFVTMPSWLCLRGAYAGYWFCNVKETNAGRIIQHGTTFSVAKFTKLLRSRLCAVGVGEGDAKAYSGHSIKRGSVQLYRSLGYKDEFIMKLVKSSEFASYSNYCEVYNDCQTNLPRFSSLTGYLNHAVTVVEEQNINDDEAMVREIAK